MPEERATEFVAAILLEALATPFFEEGTRAVFDGFYIRAGVAYVIGAIPAMAGLLTVANYWPRLRTGIGSWVIGRMAPIATDPRWWFGIALFVLVWISWPELLKKLHEAAPPTLPQTGSHITATTGLASAALHMSTNPPNPELISIRTKELQLATDLSKRLDLYSTSQAERAAIVMNPVSGQAVADRDAMLDALKDDYVHKYEPRIIEIRAQAVGQGARGWQELAYYQHPAPGPAIVGWIGGLATELAQHASADH